jgi:DNA-binding IclR family transcriptional regulator
VLDRKLRALTPYTITVPEILLRQLADVARTGVAFDREESVIGALCVAAPIFMPGQSSVAALSVTGPSHRFDPDTIVSAVPMAAFAITRGLGGVRPGTTGSSSEIPHLTRH